MQGSFAASPSFSVRSVFALAAMAMTIAITACSSSTGSGGSSSPLCIRSPSVNTGLDACYCYPAGHDVSADTAQGWTTVDACDSVTVGSALSCSADLVGSSTTEANSCTCLPYKVTCGGSGTCNCNADRDNGTETSCTGFEWCCAKDDSTGCYCSTGAFGSACANGEHTVSSCSAASVRPPSDAKPDCSGFTYPAPPPSSSSSSSGSSSGSSCRTSGPCSSSSECCGICHDNGRC